MKEQLATYIHSKIRVSDAQLAKILDCFHPYVTAKNEVLMQKGQVCQRILFVRKGCLRIYFNQEDGQESTRLLAFENNFATALVSFITQEPSLEFTQAVGVAEVFYISYGDFHRLLEEVPAWEKFYRHYLEIAYVNNTHRLMSFITMDAAERYNQLLKQSPEVVQRLPSHLVASYLRMSQETLSRLKSKK